MYLPAASLARYCGGIYAKKMSFGCAPDVAATYIMQLVSGTTPGDKRKALHDWYEWMDFEKFKEKYPLKVVLNVKKLLTQHEQWMADAKIEYTPTIFINGYQLPKQYNAADLKNLLGRTENETVISGQIVTENDLALA